MPPEFDLPDWLIQPDAQPLLHYWRTECRPQQGAPIMAPRLQPMTWRYAIGSTAAHPRIHVQGLVGRWTAIASPIDDVTHCRPGILTKAAEEAAFVS